VTKVLIEREKLQLAPSITLCPGSVTYYDAQKYDTIADVMAADFKNSKRLLYDPGDDVSMETFVRGSRACTTFRPVKRNKGMNDPRSKSMYQFKLMVVPRRLRTNTNKVAMTAYVSEASKKIYGSYATVIETMCHDDDEVWVETNKYEITRMRPPYDTNCRNYMETGFESKHHCMEACAINRSMTVFNEFPLFYAASYEPVNIQFEKGLNMTRIQLLTGFCHRFCSQDDCRSSTYSVIFKEVHDRPYSVSGYFCKFSMQQSDSPVYKIVSESIVGPATFITNVLGCISFWIGVSPFGFLLTDKIIQFLKTHPFGIDSSALYRTMVLLISLCGYIFQVSMLSREYFKFETIPQMKFDDSIIGYPASDLCHHTINIPEAASVTFREMFDHMRPSSASVNKSYQIFDLLCHSFNQLESRDDMDMLLEVRLSMNYTEKFISKSPMYVTFHTEVESAFNRNNNFLAVVRNHSTPASATLTFRILKTILQKAPYDTNCIDRSDDHIAPSESDCYEFCYTSLHLRYLKSFPADSPVFLLSTTRIGASEAQNSTMITRIKHHCQTSCLRDCVEMNFFARELQSHDAPYWFLSIRSQQETAISITHTPRIRFIDMLYVILNGASFWLSFCPVLFFFRSNIMSIIVRQNS
jgi:hypothetical protein